MSSRLPELKTLGVRIALDHFGTGYSSQAYLQHFPIGNLKIDRSFIEAIGHSRDADAIIRIPVQLGKELGSPPSPTVSKVTQRPSRTISSGSEQ